MNTKIVMTLCAVILGILGIACIFLPQETAATFGLPDSGTVAFQILGALYFGFAMVNWTAKANIIGGIYGRPIAFGNFAHFAIGTLVLIKVLEKQSETTILILTIVYALFAILFGLILFRRPARVSRDTVANN